MRMRRVLFRSVRGVGFCGLLGFFGLIRFLGFLGLVDYRRSGFSAAA